MNHPPSASTVLIDDTTPELTATITCGSTLADSDSGDVVNASTYTWWINNSATTITTVSTTPNDLGANESDVITCSIIPLDNHGYIGHQVNSTNNGTVTSSGTLPPSGGGGGGGGGAFVSVCQNLICELGETAESCPVDCAAIPFRVLQDLYFQQVRPGDTLECGEFSLCPALRIQNPNSTDISVAVFF